MSATASTSHLSPSDSLLPLELRILTLEHQILGASALSLEDNEAGPSQPSHASITRRLSSVQDDIDRLGQKSEAVKRLLTGYQQYLPFLSLPDHSSSSDAGRNGDILVADALDGLPDSAKAALLIGSATDIRSAERQLREIETLRSNGAEGSGDLERLLLFEPTLGTKTAERAEEAKELARSRDEVRALLRQYTEFVCLVPYALATN